MGISGFKEQIGIGANLPTKRKMLECVFDQVQSLGKMFEVGLQPRQACCRFDNAIHVLKLQVGLMGFGKRLEGGTVLAQWQLAQPQRNLGIGVVFGVVLEVANGLDARTQCLDPLSQPQSSPTRQPLRQTLLERVVALLQLEGNSQDHFWMHF
jgi:hypothetical protein